MRQPGKCEMGSDLGLCPCVPLLPCSSPSYSSTSSSSSSSSDATSSAAAPKSHRHHHHRPHIALLRDSRASAFDITELQARAILMLARREADSGDARSPVSPKSRTADGNNRCYLWSPGGVSMKRSLQRFLQERRSRRARAQETSSPYSGLMAANTPTTNHRRHHHHHHHHHHHRVDGDTTN